MFTATPRTNRTISLANIQNGILASFPANMPQALCNLVRTKKSRLHQHKADKNGILNSLDSSGAHQSIPPEELSLSTMSLILLPDHTDKVNNSNETPAATFIT